mgnify:CR=1 FL=1
MTTKELQKLNKLEKEVRTLKSFVANLVPYDNEGDYRHSFLDQIEKLSKSSAVFEYKGKESLVKRLS